MNAKEQIMRIGLPVAAILASIGIGFAGVTSAQSGATTTTSNTTNTQHERGMWGGGGMRPGVFGKVTAISGTSLTVEETNPQTSVITDYTVDASNAKVMKASQGSAPAASNLSAITVGDSVAVRGTVSGTSVVATEVMDGVMPHFGPGFGRGHGTHGTVTAISGNTITLTDKDGKTYTVDASSAEIGKVSSISIGDVKVGDTLDVKGDVSGTSVTAKHIMDGIPQNPQQ